MQDRSPAPIRLADSRPDTGAGDVPEQALLRALRGGYSEVMVLAYDASGNLFIVNSDMGDTEKLWMLEKAKGAVLGYETVNT